MNKKIGIWKSPLIVLGFVIILFVSCKKEDGSNNLEIIVTTALIDNITETTASGGGNITSDASLTITVRGVCWSKKKPSATKPLTTANSLSLTTDSAGTGTFISSITGLQTGTIYYVSAYATYYVEADTTRLFRTSYGKVLNFTTTQEKVLTAAVTSRSQTTATSGGIVTSGDSLTERGICWSTDATPTLADSKTNEGAGAGSFISSMTGLSPNTTYYARAYAINIADTSYGNVIIVKTYGEIANDIDGNEYNTIKIGTQVWMVENLKTTKFNDGTYILSVTDNVKWSNLITPGYCWYNNNEAKYKDTYGALYNWYTVNTGKLCPSGWHVPTDAEWHSLVMYLDSSFKYNPAKDIESEIAGGKLKETGTSHWLSPNSDAINETGFTGLPGGGRNYFGTFDDVGLYGYWWSSSTDSTSNLAWFRYLNYDDGNVTRVSLDKRSGVSVRCIKD